MTLDELDSFALKGALFTHVRKKRAYVVEKRVLCKHNDTGKWYDAVLYTRIGDGVSFVRETKSFCDNFKLLTIIGDDSSK